MSNKGFFAGSAVASKAPVGRIPKCGACGLLKKCHTPKMPVHGEGRLGILVVGDSPSFTDDRNGEVFSCDHGLYLRRVLRQCGIDIDTDCWSTYALICKSNGTVTDEQIEYCRPNLRNTIEQLKPKIILLVGTAATRSVIGWLWKENPGSITRWHGWNIPSQDLNAWVCPTYDIQYCITEDDPVLHNMFKEAIDEAVSHSERPHETVVDPRTEVDLVYDTTDAARIIRTMISKGGAVAFDYEANMLKPESPDARIVSCSVSWKGRKTIAYPWCGEAIEATRELIRSPLPKIASNMKFEERWTRRHLKTRVRNWVWDTMLAAHVLDNRKSIASLKFQAFVLLGTPVWDNHINEYLQETSDEVSTNQILEQIELKDLLLYNGLDSLYEYRVALCQMDRMGFPKPEGM